MRVASVNHMMFLSLHHSLPVLKCTTAWSRHRFLSGQPESYSTTHIQTTFYNPANGGETSCRKQFRSSSEVIGAVVVATYACLENGESSVLYDVLAPPSVSTAAGATAATAIVAAPSVDSANGAATCKGMSTIMARYTRR